MSTETATATTATDQNDGRGPGGMWWVAWRQHRWMIAATAVAALVLIGVMVTFRVTFDSWLRETAGTDYQLCRTEGDCPVAVYEVVFDRNRWWERFQVALVVAPALWGSLLGVAAFTTDLDHRTVVLAATQGISRLRWFVCKTSVVAVPAMVIMTAVGFVMQWAGDVQPHRAGQPFDLPDFAVNGAAPAVLTLVGLSLGVATGISVRGTLAGIGIAVALTALCLAGLNTVRPHLLAPTREIVPLDAADAWSSATREGWLVRVGYLGADGTNIEFTGCTYFSDLTEAELATASDRCQADAGLVSHYQDYLPADRLGPLRAAMALICAGLSAAFLVLGAFVLRRRAL